MPVGGAKWDQGLHKGCADRMAHCLSPFRSAFSPFVPDQANNQSRLQVVLTEWLFQLEGRPILGEQPYLTMTIFAYWTVCYQQLGSNISAGWIWSNICWIAKGCEKFDFAQVKTVNSDLKEFIRVYSYDCCNCGRYRSLEKLRTYLVENYQDVVVAINSSGEV